MSADNGILIYKREGKYEVHEYFASDEDGHTAFLKSFLSLEEAMIYASEQETEYGATFAGSA